MYKIARNVWIGLFSLAVLMLGLQVSPLVALAQDGEKEPAETEASDAETSETETSEPGDSNDADSDAEGEDSLEAPQLAMPDVSGAKAWEDDPAEEANEGVGSEDGDDDPASLLEMAAQSDPTRSTWVEPQKLLTLRGYFRMRGEMQKSFSLGRNDTPAFSFWSPVTDGVAPSGGGCGDSADLDSDDPPKCGDSTHNYGNMRLRLQPTISISDDVRVYMMLDVFDNMVLGSTPNGFSYAGSRGDITSPGEDTAVPSAAGTNSLTDSIHVRRAWAEVTNRSIGQLRFGRMGVHWGLGMLLNSGDGIDSDYSTDMDRLMGVFRFAGLYWMAAWDFGAQGPIQNSTFDLRTVSHDATDEDDVFQLSFAVAKRLSPEEQKERLDRGDWVLNGGLYFMWRNQFLESRKRSGTDSGADASTWDFARRDAEVFIPDLWAQFLYRGLRLEAEASLVAGSVEQYAGRSEKQDILKFGFAFEAEYRLLDDKLGIHFHTGFATGDRDVDGLSLRDDRVSQLSSDSTISNFTFHPNYRVDLILWRNIMGAVGGAYYFKPSISYDFVRSPFGRKLGLRADFIYSRASESVQTYGSNANLGFEMDASLYYQSEDGVGPLDGFVAQFQFGVLFPFEGLNDVAATYDLSTPWTLRMVLGAKF